MKRLCAKEALKLVPDHGTIGLGGGETISYLCEYIKEAGKRCRSSNAIRSDKESM
ncbi:MAG: hypothetical protein ACLVI9_11265 [Anaerostipes hadrus]